MKLTKRVILIVLDGFGAGETTDASLFGDSGAYTSKHILQGCPSINAPFLRSHGLLAESHQDVLVPKHPNKDTLSGLYELMGVVYPKLPTFPKGFSPEDINSLETLLDRPIIGNLASSGTQILQILGSEHMNQGSLIVYTSSDSVFQIAAHQEIVSLSQLYYYCMLVRNYYNSSQPIGRVIARPFIGNQAQGFTRTPYRKDFPYIHPQENLLHFLAKQKIEIFGNHVVENLFPGQIHHGLLAHNDQNCLSELIQLLSKPLDFPAFYFVDLEDLDMLYGHRRNLPGYARALECIDPMLKQIHESLTKDDLLIITADHGNDPTFLTHTDHTRENVPYSILDFEKKLSEGKVDGMHWISDLIRNFFSDVHAN
jgi:phosphopentomutase